MQEELYLVVGTHHLHQMTRLVSISKRDIILLVTTSFSMYDYDNEDENKKHYRQPTPPEYCKGINKIQIDVPLFLGCRAKDALSDPKDV